ncbi:MAG: FAD-dependent oxidoreductase [Opitutus sp.]|nr:FAD-dependent oxidoreductase [Opitutus sp.]
MRPTDTNEFDVVVIGATPGGIACAIRVAREGLRVLLTQYNHHLGGLWSNGLGAIDTQYAGRRSPLYSEFCERILAGYRERHGRDSAQYRAVITKTHSRYSATGPAGADDTLGTGVVAAQLPEVYYGKFNFEAHVAEKILNEMVAGEPNLTLRLKTVPIAVEQADACLQAVTLRADDDDGSEFRVTARVFVDCTYEGDLFALAGAPYRVGREARAEFGEPHAGRIFTALHFASKEEVGYPREAVEGRLNLEPYEAISQQVYAGSTGEGDRKVQAYTFRLCLSNDPANRVMPEKPANYDREIFLRMRNRWSLGSPIPNGKLKWNTSNLPGGNWEYPEADWPKRREILQRHRDHALGFLWFLQHDEAVPASLREKAATYGLARDEFTDNGHVPWEMYVREARRLVGRYIFKEHDGTIAPGLQRAPIHRDSIAITEWGMDSHSVSMEMTPGSRREGKILLTELTRPGQVPFRCLLPPAHDNLLVPVCLSATHVGWGTIRLEPTWMHVSESAAYAAVLAIRDGIAPAKIKVAMLQRHLVEHGVMISFFNEFDMATHEAWVSAVQFLGAKWFFASYDARPLEPLDAKTAVIWAGIAADLLTGQHRHLEDARWAEIYPAAGEAPAVAAEEFRQAIEQALRQRNLPIDRLTALWPEFGPSNGVWRRGEACQLFYHLLRK